MVLLRRIDMMTSTGSREGSGWPIKEAACPTCTVLLQVRFFNNTSFFVCFSGPIFSRTSKT